MYKTAKQAREWAREMSALHGAPWVAIKLPAPVMGCRFAACERSELPKYLAGGATLI